MLSLAPRTIRYEHSLVVTIFFTSIRTAGATHK